MQILRDFFQKSKKNFPIAYGRLIEPRSFYRLNKKLALSGGMYKVVIRCPYCGKEHAHGGCADLRKIGPTRWAHCGGGFYRLSIRRGA